MPSIRVRLQIHNGHRWISPLSWEPWCLVCNAPMQAEANASLVNPNKFLIFFPFVLWSSEYFEVSYPVCSRHRRMCNLLDWPARRGAIVSCLCWLLLPAVIWLTCILGVMAFTSIVPVPARQLLAATLAILLWGGMTLWYLAALFLKPVRLSKLSRTHITVTIRNKIAFLHIQNAGLACTPSPPNEDLLRRLRFKRQPGTSDPS